MKAIGGYFEFELGRRTPTVYPEAYLVNSGRCAFEMIVKFRKYAHVYVPEYICPVIFETLDKLKVKWSTYKINQDFEVEEPVPRINEGAGFLYVNYFGIKNEYCSLLAQQVKNLILDLTQAFYFRPKEGVDAFNSVRKFFGVPDGACLFGGSAIGQNLLRKKSWKTCEHLLRRLDDDLSGGYDAFKRNETAMCKWKPQRISMLSESVLRTVNLKEVKKRRLNNFMFIHGKLHKTNRLNISALFDSVPFCYPYFSRPQSRLREKLIDQHVFVPVYWPFIEKYVPISDSVMDLRDNLVCLPIDQRYTLQDMQFILSKIQWCDV